MIIHLTAVLVVFVFTATFPDGSGVPLRSKQSSPIFMVMIFPT